LRRQLFLWAGRHKTDVALAGLFFVALNVAAIWVFVSLSGERDSALESESKAQTIVMERAAALRELEGAAPLFADAARDHLRRRDFDGALDRIESAIRQLPNNADYHLLRGNILQMLLRWDDAVDAYETALARNPKLKAAQENLALTVRLVGAMGDTAEPPPELLTELQKALVSQQRQAEAAAIGTKLSTRTPGAKTFRQIAESDAALAPLRGMLSSRALRGRFQPLDDGTFRANLSMRPLASITPIFRVPAPISELILDGVQLPDLAMLRSMKLRMLSLKGCRGVSDLQPLSGMKFQRLYLSGTGVTDLGPISQMPLNVLDLSECNRLTDVSPLKNCASLESLILPPNAKDIGFLRDMKKIKTLSYRNPSQSVASFWREFDVK
jgi:Flp pilus assembly protein TadD